MARKRTPADPLKDLPTVYTPAFLKQAPKAPEPPPVPQAVAIGLERHDGAGTKGMLLGPCDYTRENVIKLLETVPSAEWVEEGIVTIYQLPGEVPIYSWDKTCCAWVRR